MEWQTEIMAAQQRIAGHIVETPTLQSRAFGQDIALKLE